MSTLRFGLYSGRVYSIRFGFYSGKIELNKYQIGFKSGRFGSGLSCPCSVHFRLDTMDRVWIGSGHFGCGSFQFILKFGFRSIMNRVASGVWVQIGSSHFKRRFGYESRSFISNFESRINFARSNRSQSVKAPWAACLWAEGSFLATPRLRSTMRSGMQFKHCTNSWYNFLFFLDEHDFPFLIKERTHW